MVAKCAFLVSGLLLLSPSSGLRAGQPAAERALSTALIIEANRAETLLTHDNVILHDQACHAQTFAILTRTDFLKFANWQGSFDQLTADLHRVEKNWTFRCTSEVGITYLSEAGEPASIRLDSPTMAAYIQGLSGQMLEWNPDFEQGTAGTMKPVTVEASKPLDVPAEDQWGLSLFARIESQMSELESSTSAPSETLLRRLEREARLTRYFDRVRLAQQSASPGITSHPTPGHSNSPRHTPSVADVEVLPHDDPNSTIPTGAIDAPTTRTLPNVTVMDPERAEKLLNKHTIVLRDAGCYHNRNVVLGRNEFLRFAHWKGSFESLIQELRRKELNSDFRCTTQTSILYTNAKGEKKSISVSAMGEEVLGLFMPTDVKTGRPVSPCDPRIQKLTPNAKYQFSGPLEFNPRNCWSIQLWIDIDAELGRLWADKVRRWESEVVPRGASQTLRQLDGASLLSIRQGPENVLTDSNVVLSNRSCGGGNEVVLPREDFLKFAGWHGSFAGLITELEKVDASWHQQCTSYTMLSYKSPKGKIAKICIVPELDSLDLFQDDPNDETSAVMRLIPHPELTPENHWGIRLFSDIQRELLRGW